MTAFSPSLRQLRFFVALDAERHFGRAATVMGVGQSTLSAGIAELERLIGVTLVERTKRSVRFTDLGDAFAARARRVIAAADELTDFAARSAAPMSEPLTLGIIPTIAPFLLPRLLTPLQARFPALELRLREQTSEAACTALHRGLLDAVVLAPPYDCGQVEVLDILTDPLVMAIPRRDPPSPVEADPLLLLEDGHCLNDHGLIACGIPRARTATMIASSLHTLVGLVEAGMGMTFLPQLAIDAGLLSDRAVDVVALQPGAVRRIVLAWRTECARDRDMQVLGTALREILNDPARKPIT